MTTDAREAPRYEKQENTSIGSHVNKIRDRQTARKSSHSERGKDGPNSNWRMMVIVC